MVKAELKYNPYLVETKIKFNGNEPRINSLVEKYDESILQSWIKKLPYIFHDEMNGYDFEFEFSGTELEFEELKKSFINANVTEEEVILTHLNKLESRDEKIKRIKDLLEWFSNSPNRQFDYEKFINLNKEFLTKKYQYIILHEELESTPILESKNIVIQSALNINLLDNIDLYNTPILICVNNETKDILEKEIKFLLKTKNIKKEQLFFYIDKDLSVSFVERTIKDLDLLEPQIVKSIDDSKIIRYFDIYPINEFITKMIHLLRELSVEISINIQEERKKVDITNKNVHEQIENLDLSMKILKDTIRKFEYSTDVNYNNKYMYLIEEFKKKINRWRMFRIKESLFREAYSAAEELSENCKKWANEFDVSLRMFENKLQKEIYDKYNELYKLGNHYMDYKTIVNFKKNNKDLLFDINIKNNLLDLKEENTVFVKKKALDILFIPDEVEGEYVLETTWYMSQWKEYIEKYVESLTLDIINESNNNAIDYAISLINDYSNKLKEILEFEENQKEKLKALLSNEERQLEIDNEWLDNLKEQLMKIEKE